MLPSRNQAINVAVEYVWVMMEIIAQTLGLDDDHREAKWSELEIWKLR